MKTDKPLKKVSILYVEDEEDIRFIFTRILKKFVKELYIATNGEEGLKKFNELNPDIIITEPKMTGIEMIEKIRQKNHSIPIIITTAFNEKDYLIKAIKLKVDGFFLKPIENIEEYIKILEEKANYIINKKENKKKSAIIKTIIENFFDIAFFVENNKIVTLNEKAKNFIKCENINEFLNNTIPQLKLENLKKELIEYKNHFYVIKINEYLQNQFIITMKKLK